MTEEQPPATEPEAPVTEKQPPADAKTPAKLSRGRVILVNALLGVTTVLLVIGIFAIWANRLLFNADNWSNTSTQLLQDPNIRSSTANYLVDQLYANVNVSQLLSNGLPPRLQPLAAPAAGALRNLAVQGAELALTRPRVQNLWAQANRAALLSFIAIVKGGKGPVGTKQGVVTLNLAQIVGNIASRLGLPPDIASKLPPSVANLTILKSNQLKFVQDAGNGIQGLALLLTILVPVLFALAIVLAPGRRRRTLMKVGFAGILAGVLVLLGRSILHSQVPGALTNDASLKPTIAAVITISTAILSDVAGACIVIGIPLILAGWFAGPSRVATSGRQVIAPFLREHAPESYGIALAVMALIFIWDPIPATGKPAGIIVLTLLAMLGVYVLRRQTETEFPDAQSGATAQRLRTRAETMRKHRRQGSGGDSSAASSSATSSSATSSSTIPDQLRQLAELRDRGEIDADEYQAAKSQLLRG